MENLFEVRPRRPSIALGKSRPPTLPDAFRGQDKEQRQCSAWGSISACTQVCTGPWVAAWPLTGPPASPWKAREDMWSRMPLLYLTFAGDLEISFLLHLYLGFPTKPTHTETGPWGSGKDGWWVVGIGCWPPGEVIAAVCPLISKTPPSVPFLSLSSDILLPGMSSTVCLPIQTIFVLKPQLRPPLFQEVFPGPTCGHGYFSSG